MAKFDVIVVGELNADLILQDIPSFPEIGKEKLAKNMTLTMGSASAILATNIARLGLKVGFIGKLGRDSLGKIVTDTLRQRKVDCSGIAEDGSVQTGVTVVLSFPKDYAMLTYMGAMDSFSLADVDFDYLKKARHMHFSSFYLQPKMRPRAAELFSRAKEMGLTTSLDPGWDPQEKWDDILPVLRYVDVFLPNEQEMIHIGGAQTVEEAYKKIGSTIPFVVVKRGSQGALCMNKGQTLAVGAYRITPVDTTGAGDSFNSGFLFQWLTGGNLHNCMRYGAACGAIATTKMGGATASPSLAELDVFFAEHRENIFPV
jgi:sugar/nucleoside kinase (ribokinase family)